MERLAPNIWHRSILDKPGCLCAAQLKWTQGFWISFHGFSCSRCATTWWDKDTARLLPPFLPFASPMASWQCHACTLIWSVSNKLELISLVMLGETFQNRTLMQFLGWGICPCNINTTDWVISQLRCLWQNTAKPFCSRSFCEQLKHWQEAICFGPLFWVVGALYESEYSNRLSSCDSACS